MSQVSKFGILVESEFSQSANTKCRVESELIHLNCHVSQSRVSPKKSESSATLPAGQLRAADEADRRVDV